MRSTTYQSAFDVHAAAMFLLRQPAVELGKISPEAAALLQTFSPLSAGLILRV
jgi:hypothetical protein